MEKLRSQASPAVINALKAIFAHHSIPNTVVSDNGPAYASEEFNNVGIRPRHNIPPLFTIQWQG